MIRELLNDAFECMTCNNKAGFAFARQADGRFYRFPPVIGAARDASVLFIGINPRISRTNEVLHQNVTNNRHAFADLAANRTNGEPYIAINGKERHYRRHARMIDKLFSNRSFEEVAATTELYFCASESARGLDRDDNPCAEKFMARIFALMRPRAVVAVGNPVKRYLQRYKVNSGNDLLFDIEIGGHTTTVVPVPHPNAYIKRSTLWDRATVAVASVLEGKPVTLPLIGDGPVLTATRHTGGNEIILKRSCEWNERYGWKPFQRPADLDYIASKPGARIEFHLTRKGNTEFILSMTSDEWKAALGRYYLGPNWRRNGYTVSLTRSCGGRPIRNFIERWTMYIKRMNDA